MDPNSKIPHSAETIAATPHSIESVWQVTSNRPTISLNCSMVSLERMVQSAPRLQGSFRSFRKESFPRNRLGDERMVPSRHTQRHLSVKSPTMESIDSGIRSTPDTKRTVWERTALAVQHGNHVNRTGATPRGPNPGPNYMATIRATHDPAWHIRTIEDELKATIGLALGKKGHEILSLVQQMNQELQRYQELDSSPECTSTQERTRASVERYNDVRRRAIQARWELMVQRQAAGFIVNNQAHVMQHYPIPPALVEEANDANTTTVRYTYAMEPTPRTTGPLDWWQRVGRWK